MKPVDRRRVVTGLAFGAALLQAGLAGIAHLVRRSSDRELDGVLRQVESLQQLVTRPQAEPETPAATHMPRWRLPDGPDVVATLQAVQQCGDATDVAFDSLIATRSETVGKQTFTATGRTAPERLCALVAALEAAERLIVVEGGRLSPADEARVAFELQLATWHRGAER